MTDHWLCIDCNRVVSLNLQYRCEDCGSNGIVRVEKPHLEMRRDRKDLFAKET